MTSRGREDRPDETRIERIPPGRRRRAYRSAMELRGKLLLDVDLDVSRGRSRAIEERALDATTDE